MSALIFRDFSLGVADLARFWRDKAATWRRIPARDDAVASNNWRQGRLGAEKQSNRRCTLPAAIVKP
jgi:hypothetical protein